jgi:hypothetical protein
MNPTEAEVAGEYTRDEVITINRADLPEVSERDGKFWAGSGPEECVARGTENPNWLRNHANSALALAEFIEAREKYAREANAAEHKRNKRRDELAELFSGIPGTRYGLRNRDLRNAIDHIIDLENKAHE